LNIFIPLMTFLLLGVPALALSLRGLPDSERRWMMRLLLVAFSARLLLATIFQLFPQLRVFHEDADGYEVRAQWMATGWRGEGPPVISDGLNSGYVQMLAGLYYVFGRYQVVGAYFNGLLGSLLGALVYRLSARMFHRAVVRRASILVTLMPSMILWSSLALKDVAVTFSIAMALSSCLALRTRVTPWGILGVAVPLAIIQSMRFYVVYFVAFAVVVGFLLDRGKRFVTGIFKQVFLGLTVVALFAIFGWTDVAGSQLDYFSLEYASSYRHGMAASARSGFQVDADISTPGSALAYLPVGVAHVLLAPFPWQMTGLRPVMAAPETIFWWLLIPATLRGIGFSIKYRFALAFPLLLFAILLTLVYALMGGNAGAAFRFRAQILVFLFIFCALGQYQKKCKNAGIDQANLLAAEGATASQEEAIATTPAPATLAVQGSRMIAVNTNTGWQRGGH
jgi:hypothetical protein